MSNWLVSRVLEQLTSIGLQVAESGVRLVVGVTEDVEKLRNTFRTIQAVLEDAEERQVKEKAVKIWLDKLQNVAYNMEDVLDEWNTAILKLQIPRDDPSSSTSTLTSKVRSLIQLPSLSIPRLVQRRDIGIKIKELNERLQAISKEKDDFAFLVDITRNHNDLQTERPKTTYFVDVSQIRGRDQDKDTLISMLLNNPERGTPSVISIVGMGGIGKTTLAQLVYNHHELNAYFQTKIWVCVSDPFDEMRIAKAILETLTSSSSGFNELNTVLKEIHESIMGKRFLLVLDDVWNEDEGKWQSLKSCLNSGSQGSKILVTTRKENVATIMGCTKLLHLGKLSQDECWSLFSHIAFFGRADRERESLEDIGRKIADRCQGLPLAAKALGGLLRFKRSREQWQRILDSNTWELDEAEKGIFSPLLLSYYDLPSPLRQCFSYCAIFPKNHDIEKDLLIKLWMAQGYLGERQGNEMEIMGEEYFDNLATRSFFQEFEKDENDGSIIRCKMHDIVHDFAQLLRRSESSVVLASNDIEEQRVDFYHENVRHLTLICEDEDIGIPNAMYNVKKLRSLLLDSNSYYPTGLEACLPKLFDQLTCLRTLSLWGDPSVEEMSIKELPKEIGKLIHLRYLSLEGNARLSELPETLCDLCNLQTLNIRSCCKLQKLPHGIEKLINLRHLQNKYTKSLSMPKGMQGLTFLQTLEEFAVKGGGGITGLEDLGKLIHVRGNLELKGLGNVVEEKEAREARLSTKAGLHSLTLRFDGGYFKEQETRIEDEALVFRALQPSQNLQILCIEYCVGPVFPSWMTSLTMLKILHIYWCNWESLPPMGKLRSLEYLTMSFMNVKKVGEEFLGIETSSSSSVNHNITYFPNLKELTFQYMAGWEEWEYEHEKVVLEGGGRDKSSSKFSIIMPKLEYLCIYGCSVLKTLPHQVLQSRALQQLEIRDSRILYKRFNKSTGDDWPSISHIPAVLVD